MVNFRIFDGEIIRSSFCGAYISKHIHFAKVYSNANDVNDKKNPVMTAKIRKQGYRSFNIIYQSQYLLGRFSLSIQKNRWQ